MTKLTEEFHEIILPVIVGFIVFDVIGLLGNTLVIYVFSSRYQKNHYRFLVLGIGILDFVSCCTTVPIETVTTWMWFETRSVLVCKAKKFFIQYTSLASIFMLFIMAVHKHRQICMPLGRQLSKTVLIILCTAGILVSLLFAAPSALFAGVNNRTVGNNHTLGKGNITEEVFICETEETWLPTSIPRMYSHSLAAYYFILMATIVLYVFVAKRVIQHFRRTRKYRQAAATLRANPIFHMDTEDHVSNCVIANNDDNHVHLTYIKHEVTSAKSVAKETKLATKAATNPKASSYLTSSHIRRVVIMVILSASFAVTFLLGQILGYTFSIRGSNDFSSLYELRWLFVCYRLYFINYSLNAVVYFALDGKFRKEVKDIFGCHSE